MKYQVDRLGGPMSIDADWDKAVWREVEPLELNYHMGDKPQHFPKVQAKLLYDDEFVYVIFRVEDRFVRAVARQHQDPVCRDSCVEFFFAPGADLEDGYFNLEMNCGGIILLNFQTIPRKNNFPLKAEDVERIKVAHSMPRRVLEEIKDPIVWTVQYRLPVDILAKYCPSAKKPAAGVVWRANFFKCADDTSHPHWLTWSRVDNPKPDFHVPQFFGELEFK
ncbi:MAG: carbohydrate-binding family 9-like protein [Planctomycetota bacterium]